VSSDTINKSILAEKNYKSFISNIKRPIIHDK